MGTVFVNIYRLLKKRRVLFFLLFIGALAFAGFFASQIRLEEDITKMMPSDAKVERLNAIFKNSKFLDKLVVTVSLPDSSAAADPQLLMEYTDSLVEGIKQIDTNLIKDITYKVNDDVMYDVYNTFIDNLPVFLEEKDYTTLDHLITSERLDTTLEKNYKTLLSPASVILKKNILRDPIGITPYALKRMQSLQFDDNFELDNGYIFTKDKKHLLFFIVPKVKSSETEKNSQLLAGLDSAVNKTIALSGNRIYAEYFGSAAVAAGNAVQIKKDVKLTLTITILGLFLFITFFFKRIEVFFIIFIPVVFGAAFSLALLYLLKGTISGIAIGAGSIILGIAMDYTIHFYTHFKHLNSAEDTVKDLAFPLTLGSTTTIGALLSLTFVKSEALQDFGMFAAFSLLGAALFTLVIFPHLMRKKKGEIASDHDLSRKPNIIERIASYKFENNKYLIAFILLICLISVFTSQKVGFETDVMKMNYVDDKLAKAEQNLNSISNVSLRSIYLVSSGKNLDEALTNNEKNLSKLQQLEKDQLIKKYSTVSTFLLSSEEQQRRIQRWNNYWTQEKMAQLKAMLIEKSAKYKFKENAFDQFYAALDKQYAPVGIEAFSGLKATLLDNYVTEKPEETTVVTVIKTTVENEDQVYNSFTENEDLVVFDKKFLTNRFIEIIKNNFNLILTISSLLVLIMLIISYGRFELALITYIPMVLSWLCILGLMGAFDIKFNIINIIISTFIFGLGDDYSIFITDGLMNEYKTGQKNLDSYKTGIFISATTTMIGIGVLIFASHPALKSIGLITIIGMFSVLIISNTIQPALFKFFITNRTDKKRVPFTFLSLLQSVWAFLWFTFGCLTLIPLGFIIIKLLPIPKKTRLKIFHAIRHAYTKSMMFVHLHVRKKYINELNETLEKPAVVVSNHHSVIDSLLMQSLNPKLILMVNDWVWDSPFMGPIVRLGGFIPKSAGYEENLGKIKQLFDDGYSLGIFPEGSRSETPKIGRFHKGAFYIADKLHVDIVPIIFHGTAFVQGKDDNFLLKPGRITVKYLPRILADDKSFGDNYTDKTKNISKYFKAEYAKMREEIETVDYYFNRLSKNYIYKGPLVEWYMRVKVKMEDNYRLFESLLPKKGTITDIGCGYGFLPYMLAFMSEDRVVIGTDYDEEKIAVAANSFSRTKNISFFAADATECELPKSDAFIMSDILHYLPAIEQEKLIVKCIRNLNPNGMILIRDADSSMSKRHFGTRYTEFVSTNVGFNKTKNKLEFVPSTFIIDVVKREGLEIKKIDNTKLTSNVIYVIKN
ncbi:MAG: glycerol acyltransferase [Bacteroidota bacterium]|jgi:1-acyl-sn-glycerol-3-phosphate acyltransferase|nr:glycerol acyltransferase [Bacteroidota bacterium]